MKEQLDMFSPHFSVPIPKPGSRASDPVTSHLAALKAEKTQIPHIERIRLALERIGSGTFYEIAAAAQMRESQVWRRLPEMQKAGIIDTVKENGVEVLKDGALRAKCRVWEIAP